MLQNAPSTASAAPSGYDHHSVSSKGIAKVVLGSGAIRKREKFWSEVLYQVLRECLRSASVEIDKPYPDGMTEADVLKKAGLSLELVHARSVLLAAKEFAVLDNLAAGRDAARKASLKDYDRRKRQSEKENRAAAKAKSQSRDLANDNHPADREVRPRTGLCLRG
jgi:hypothetical protein